MIDVKLATFTKRANSTAQFSGTWTTFSCALKDNCSIISPVIELRTTSNLNGYNYMYISDFGRYYFITDISHDNGSVIITGSCDVLATYKTEIGSASEYVTRSASDYNGDVIDTLYPIKAQTTMLWGGNSGSTEGGVYHTGTFDTDNITYIIGVVNNTTTDKYGAVKYYAISSGELANLMSFLLGGGIIMQTEGELTTIDATLTSFKTEIENGIVRALANPSQFIVESYAIPYTVKLGSQETVTMGWWPTTAKAYPVQRDVDFTQTVATGKLAFPTHPQATTKGKYLNTSPYMRMWLYLGVFGYYPIDTLKCVDSDGIGFTIFGDIFGNVKCNLYTYKNTEGGGYSVGAFIDTLSANVKCNFPIGQVSVDALRGASATLSTIVGTAATADPLVFAMGIGNAVQAMLPQSRTSGSTGTFCNVFQAFYCAAEAHEIVDEDNTHRGRPLCAVRQINTLSGYIQVSDADIAISGTKEENEKIKSYMNGGFYYE